MILAHLRTVGAANKIVGDLLASRGFVDLSVPSPSLANPDAEDDLHVLAQRGNQLVDVYRVLRGALYSVTYSWADVMADHQRLMAGLGVTRVFNPAAEDALEGYRLWAEDLRGPLASFLDADHRQWNAIVEAAAGVE